MQKIYIYVTISYICFNNHCECELKLLQMILIRIIVGQLITMLSKGYDNKNKHKLSFLL